MKSLVEYIRESQAKQFADVIVVSKEGSILLLQRAGYIKRYGGKYALPGGSTDKGEDSKESAIRELKEETSLIAKDIELFTTWTYSTGDKSDVYAWKSDISQEELESQIKLSREHRRYKFIQDISEIKETGWAGEQKDIVKEYLTKEEKA